MLKYFMKIVLLISFISVSTLCAHTMDRQSSGIELFLLILSILTSMSTIILFKRYNEYKRNYPKNSASNKNEITTLQDSCQKFQKDIDKLQKSAQIKDAYLANVSHEIRTPISAVLGMSTLVLQTKLDSKQNSYVSKIYNSANLLLGLINQILDFSKIEAGEMQLEEIEFDINSVFENLSDIVSFASNEKNIDVIFDVDYDTPIKLIGDPLRINQVLINIVMNALKFTREGEVSIHVRELPSQEAGITLEFIVKDTGIGIKQENIDKLFNAFSQVDDATSRIYGGTGLGLSISKKLIELMDGDIRVESVHGQGTSFIFTINVIESEKSELRKYRLLSKESMNKRVLIVDSSEASSKALYKKLAYFHFYIASTSSWGEAQNCIKEQSDEFDIIFINAKSFSKDDAISMLNQLSTQSARVVFITYNIGSLSHEDLEKIKEPIFFERPYSQQRLYELILQIEKGDEEKKINMLLPKDSLKIISGSKIILAEDNIINQSIVTGVLENTGIEIDIANNGVEVLTLLKSADYDLILMDIDMPVKDGYETAKEIREQNNPIPIIALSASVLEDDIKRAKDSGMNAHLGKPICIEELYSTLVKYIQR